MKECVFLLKNKYFKQIYCSPSSTRTLNIQQNNVNGWQNLENYRKLSKTMKNTQNPKKQYWKNNEKTTQNIENK